MPTDAYRRLKKMRSSALFFFGGGIRHKGNHPVPKPCPQWPRGSRVAARQKSGRARGSTLTAAAQWPRQHSGRGRTVAAGSTVAAAADLEQGIGNWPPCWSQPLVTIALVVSQNPLFTFAEASSFALWSSASLNRICIADMASGDNSPRSFSLLICI